jgi:hypothetical protein
MEQHPSTSASDDADDAPVVTETDDGDLPLRRASESRVVCRVRRMDDPEILERVLSGLLNLE